ncbi:hypothetical protein PPL_11149 [Heterostelium album PN500]|uniref:Uncharacterized protein n=1 Tax=Heterostelium pallidum (strain ATCC 26659 / Pp 5 / PN500) TaxID=670386 RepID=D3BTN9_HETP5|nr:hypothetical protein PPL_11149 [Heterostelium album PN500]EFA75075.1 hypothetical protein PPL_11149 [Heterostelium album PN500]|eukprot:XP_020427209.1 hypothetical protein PPL_11149 [Heterostelium album PN500]
MSSIDEIDIYSDLAGTSNVSLSYEQLEEKLDQLQSEFDKLKQDSLNSNQLLNTTKQQLQQTTVQRDNLQKINEILMKNISSLYKTALAESQRKDREIESLREQLANNNSARKQPSLPKINIKIMNGK